MTWNKEVREEKRKEGGTGMKKQRRGGRINRERKQRGNEGDSREKDDYNAH